MVLKLTGITMISSWVQHEYMWTEMKKEFESLDKVLYYIDQWSKTRKELIDQEGLKPMPGLLI